MWGGNGRHPVKVRNVSRQGGDPRAAQLMMVLEERAMAKSKFLNDIPGHGERVKFNLINDLTAQ